MKNKLKSIPIVLLLAFIFSSFQSFAHCEVPCGIYDDSVRITLIKEHISTIEKAMKEITKYSQADAFNYNQIVRWVTNKEKHAEEIQHIVSQYFLHQRIKLVDGSDKAKVDMYHKHLTLLHQMLVYSMKCKQGTDLGNVEKLRKSTQSFSDAYFHKH